MVTGTGMGVGAVVAGGTTVAGVTVGCVIAGCVIAGCVTAGAVVVDTVTGEGVTVGTDTGTLNGIAAALETAVPALVVTHLAVLAAELSTGFTYDETVKQYLVLGCRPVTT